MFTETEAGQALREIRARDPAFDMVGFLRVLRRGPICIPDPNFKPCIPVQMRGRRLYMQRGCCQGGSSKHSVAQCVAAGGAGVSKQAVQSWVLWGAGRTCRW